MTAKRLSQNKSQLPLYPFGPKAPGSPLCPGSPGAPGLPSRIASGGNEGPTCRKKASKSHEKERFPAH